MANKRIYFAIQGLAIKPEPIGAAVSTWADGDVVHGVQSVAVTTTFNSIFSSFNLFTKCLPTKPVAPVTNTFIL